MGCDYYVVTQLDVYTVKDGDDYESIELSREPHYYAWDSYDSDSEGERQAYYRRRHEEMNRYDKEKLIYENGEFIITNEDKHAWYKKLVEDRLNIEFAKVSKIVKNSYCQQR